MNNVLQCSRSVSSSSIRLISPLNNGVGRVEVFYNTTWGTVCSDGFTDLTAEVVCRELGRYHKSFRTKMIRNFGFGTGQIWLDHVDCAGNESSLVDCSHNPFGEVNCTHDNDVGVICDERSLTVRLGNSHKSGNLEVYHQDSWKTVYRLSGIQKVAATVVCRTLGYDSGEPSDNYTRLMYTWLYPVKCSMNNTDLSDCLQKEPSGIYWNYAVTLQCFSFTEGSSAARLMSSSTTPGEGRLELYYGGQWGKVCSDGAGSEVAAVVCRMMGYNGGGERTYVSASGTAILKDVHCKGTETNINECAHSKWNYTHCSYKLGVKCYSATDTHHGIRLVSSIYGAGRVEVLYNNVWGTVCRRGFTVKEARVVCRMAKLPWSGAYVSSHTEPGDGVIWLDNVNCTGSETELDHCSHSPWGTNTCSNSDDVGVVCIKARLVSGEEKTRGRLEIFYNNLWGSVCHTDFTNISAEVACRMVGQSNKHAYFTAGGSYGHGTGRVWMSDVQCLGNEKSLGECSHTSWGNTSCTHSGDVGVVCSYSPEIHLDPNTDVLNIAEGNDLVVRCVVDDANPEVRTFTWSHNGVLTSGNIFRIASVSRSDEGNLSCSADNGLGMNPGRAETVIDVFYPPEVNLMPNSSHGFINVVLGENLTVDCVVTAANPDNASITWSHHGHISSGTTFHLQNVTYSHEGRLTCAAHNGVGTRPGQADTFIRVQERHQERLVAGTSTWTPIHTGTVVTGAVAVVIIVALVVLVIHLHRKQGSTSVQTLWKSKTEGAEQSNPYYNPEACEADYDEPIPVSEGATLATPKANNKAQKKWERKPKMVAASNPAYDKEDSEAVYEVPRCETATQLAAPKAQNIEKRPDEMNTMLNGALLPSFILLDGLNDIQSVIEADVQEDLKRKLHRTKATASPTCELEDSELEEVYENFGTINKAKSQASQFEKSGSVYCNGADDNSEEVVYENF